MTTPYLHRRATMGPSGETPADTASCGGAREQGDGNEADYLPRPRELEIELELELESFPKRFPIVER